VRDPPSFPYSLPVLGNKSCAFPVSSVKARKTDVPSGADKFDPRFSTSTEDADLVLASKAGDTAAFEELVARYDRKLFRIANHILHNPEDAQDVVQDAFIKVFQNLGQFRTDSKFSTWLYRIVVNQSLMELRKQRRKPSTGIELSIDGDEEGQFPIDSLIGGPIPNSNTTNQSCAICSPDC
jgi:Sigma-70 region 2